MEHILGIGDYAVSNNKADIIKTFALASCVAVTLYSPQKQAAGMIHIALPAPHEHKREPDKKGYYATTGIPILIELMIKQYGCRISELDVQLYGGAQSIRQHDVFCIGKKNIDTACSVLTQMGAHYQLGDVGGFISRSIELDVKTGGVRMTTQPIRI